MHRFISAINRLRGAWRNRGGAVAVEFAFLFPIALVFTFGLIEFSLILFDFHRLSEATRRGARAAIIQNPVADLSSLDPSDTSTTLTCQGTGTVPSDDDGVTGLSGATCDSPSTEFQTILQDMQGIKPDLTGDNVTISYTATGVSLGSAGLVTPMVTVKITGFQYSYFVLNMVDDLLKLSGGSGTDFSSNTTFDFPDFATSRVGPTQNSG